jgi:hypothetical protein
MMTPAEATFWKQELPHVRWIGGPPDAGKSTVSLLLAERYGCSIYRQDGHEREHIARADRTRFPCNTALREQLDRGETGFFEQWVTDPPHVQAVRTFDIWTERLPMICEDLQALPNDTLCIVEGPGLFPETIRPLLHDPHQAIWLIPTSGFKRESHTRRDKSAWRHGTSNPEQALRHHIERDLILTGMYRDQLREEDRAILIDGTTPAPAIAEQVAAWFGLVM